MPEVLFDQPCPSRDGARYRHPRMVLMDDISKTEVYQRAVDKIEQQLACAADPYTKRSESLRRQRALLMRRDAPWGLVLASTGESEHGPCDQCTSEGLECVVPLKTKFSARPDGKGDAYKVAAVCIGCKIGAACSIVRRSNTPSRRKSGKPATRNTKMQGPARGAPNTAIKPAPRSKPVVRTPKRRRVVPEEDEEDESEHESKHESEDELSSESESEDDEWEPRAPAEPVSLPTALAPVEPLGVGPVSAASFPGAPVAPACATPATFQPASVAPGSAPPTMVTAATIPPATTPLVTIPPATTTTAPIPPATTSPHTSVDLMRDAAIDGLGEFVVEMRRRQEMVEGGLDYGLRLIFAKAASDIAELRKLRGE